MKELIDGYLVSVTDEMVIIRKDGHVRMAYFGTTDNKVTLRQLVDAVKNADCEG